MDLRFKFNEDEANYDRWRPTYTSALFDEIIRYADLNETKQALEIGIGTGQATMPILQTKCNLVAIELGEKLAQFSMKKFAACSNFQVINVPFENFLSDYNTFDLIYSATAFHWIPEEIGYAKTFNLLKSGGALALFWNHAFVNRSDDLLHQEIRKVYNKYKPTDKQPVEFNEADCSKTVELLKNYGFINVYSKLFHQVRTFTAKEYVALLNTYSDHRSLVDNVKSGLENEIALAINSFGGKLHVYDTMDLYLARKP